MEVQSEAIARKAHSIAILKQYQIPFLESLPVIETKSSVRIRTKEEIARRVLACLITIQVACDMANGCDDMKESRRFLTDLLQKYHVQDDLTGNESIFFTGNPDEQSIIDMVWKYEACWVLLWALGIVEELSFPSSICDCEFAIHAFADRDSFDDFMQQVHLRSMDEILDEADLIFRYDWACVDARIHGKDAPQGLEESVVLERHRALNWLIDADGDNDWDNVSTNT